MKFAVTFILFLLFALTSSQSQLVRRWYPVAEGTFCSNDFRHNLAIAGGKYLAASGYRKHANDTSIVVFSSDSGQSWKRIYTSFAFNLDKINESNWAQRIIQSMEMPSEKLLFLVCKERLKGESGQTWHPYLMRTTDIGNNWDRIDFDTVPVTFKYTEISMLNDTFGILITGLNPSIVDSNKIGFFKTFDGGKSWNKFSSFEKTAYMLRCFSQTDYVVDTGDSIYTSKDGAVSWSKFAKPSKVGDYSFISRNKWILSGTSVVGADTNYYFKRQIFKTNDAGINWDTLANEKMANIVLFKAKFFDDSIGLSSSDVYGGDFMSTTDGGRNWSYETTPSDYYLEMYSNACFISEERAVVLTSSRICLSTGDSSLMPPVVKYSLEPGSLIDYTLKWNTIIGGNKYKLQISKTKAEGLPLYSIPDYENKLFINLDNLTDTTFSLIGKLQFSKDYHIRAKTYNDSMESDWSKFVLIRTPKDTSKANYLDSCKQLFPKNNSLISPDSVTFVWNKVKDATYYTLNVTTPEGYAFNLYDYYIKNLTDTNYTIKNLKNNSEYLWWAVAHSEDKEDSPFTFYVIITDKNTSTVIDNRSKSGIAYPNPATDFINYEFFASNGIARLKITNSIGCEVISNDLYLIDGLNKITIDVKSLENGLYTVRILTKNSMLQELINIVR